MPRRVKSVSREIRAAIGELVIEVTFMQYLAARLVAVAGIADNDMSLLQPGGKPLELARKAIRTFKDPQVAGRTRSWLREAEELERQRHEVVRSIDLHTHRPGLSMDHPRSGSMVRRTTREVVELAAKACKHAEDGNYMSIFDWPSALALARTKLAMRAGDACRSSGAGYCARKPSHPASQRQRPARRRDAAGAEL